MYYGSNRATAITLSTTLLALLLAASFAAVPTVHGASATVAPKDYAIFCDSTGDLTVTFDTGGATWYGVAIEIPKEFIGLADLDTSKVDAREITYDPRFIAVFDEELYYPYNREYYWVQIGADPTYDPNWPGISGTGATAKTVTLKGITAPGVARTYQINLYYTLTNFPATASMPMDFSASKGTALAAENVKVAMREEASTISGTVTDTSYTGTTGNLNTGYVTATAIGGPLDGKVVAKTTIASNGLYSLTGLYEGTYRLTAWGRRTAVSTIDAYGPTELALTVTVGRKATLTGVNIAVVKGGVISGYVRLYDGVSPVTPNSVFSGLFTLPNTGPGGTPALPVRLELVDGSGNVCYDTTVNVPEGASSVAYTLKECYKDKGIPAGTYTLKAYAFGFVQTAAVTVSVSAPGGVTIDVPLVKGGGIQGTIYYLNSQGIATTLSGSETIVVEALDASGALKGLWIGETTASVSTTLFQVRGACEVVQPVAPSSHTTVALKTYSGRGVKAGGLADGGYTLKVSVRGFIQQEPYPTAVISYAGTGSVSIYLRQGGQITGTLYAKDPTGVYAENWARATPPAWEYDGAVTATRIRAYIYDAAGDEMGYVSGTAGQVGTSQTDTISFNGRARGTDWLQCGYKQTALKDGTYTVKVYTWGYWQPTPYPTATIYSGGTQAVDLPVRRGGSVNGVVTFREAGIIIPGGVTANVKVQVKDAAGVTQGVAFYSITTQTQLQYSIYGKYKYGLEKDQGLVDGAYTVALTLYQFTQPTQTVTVAGGSSATVNFDSYKMGSIQGTIRGAVTYQTTPIRLSWVKISLSASPEAYTTYSSEGTYSIYVPDGTYTMTFTAYGYESYTVSVTPSSGATQVISADLVESFAPIPEFPISAIFTLAASLGLAIFLLRWIRKPIVPKV